MSVISSISCPQEWRWIQDSKMTASTKWSNFGGLSMKNYSSIVNILNVRTKTITFQFHVVYYNHFETLYSVEEKVLVVWNSLTNY